MQRVKTKAPLLSQVFDDMTSDFVVSSANGIKGIVAQLSNYEIRMPYSHMKHWLKIVYERTVRAQGRWLITAPESLW